MTVAAHVPVLLREVLEALAPRGGATLLDGTLGLGGHSLAWLEATAAAGATGRVVGLDRDAEVLERARERIEERFPGRLHTRHGSYEECAAALEDAGIDAADAALLDLGASSVQLDDPARGFSFRAAGPLDMRMDPREEGVTAAEVVNGAPEEELERIVSEYGEEPAARRVARRIVEERARAPFRDTLRLAEVVAEAVGGRRGRLHPATKVFQALRIHVNDELGRLRRGLPAVAASVRPGGRMGVISFHRLEDRLVKGFFAAGQGDRFREIGSRTPGREEERTNPRSRSARLRAVEVLGAGGEEGAKDGEGRAA